MQTQDEGEGTIVGGVGITRLGDVGNQAPSDSGRGGLVDDDEDAMDIDTEIRIQQDIDNEHAMDIINTELRIQQAIANELRAGCADKNEACEVDDESDLGSQHESVPGGEAESSNDDDDDDDAESSDSEAITTGRRRSGAAGRGMNWKRWLVDDEASSASDKGEGDSDYDDDDDDAESSDSDAITTGLRRSGAAGRGLNQKRWLVDDQASSASDKDDGDSDDDDECAEGKS